MYPSAYPHQPVFFTFPFLYRIFFYLYSHLFRLFPFSHDLFYTHSSDNSGCLNVATLSENVCDKFCLYIDQSILASENKISSKMISKGVKSESFVLDVDQLSSSSLFSDSDLLEFQSVLSVLNRVLSRSTPFSIGLKCVAQRLTCSSADVGDTNTNFHIDRWVPAVKSFIFLNDAISCGSPYQYIPYSHVIDQRYLTSIFRYSLSLLKTKKISYPFTPPYPESYTTTSYGSKGSVLLTAVNGFHRRSPFSKCGTRYTLRFVFYSSLNPFSRLKSFLSALL